MNVEHAEIVLPCAELVETLRFYVETLGFRVDAIHPADDPRVAVLSGHGLRLRLERGAQAAPGLLRFACKDPSAFAGGATELVAPNGTRIELVPSNPPVVLPALRPSFVLSRLRDATFVEGRASMRYRDLIPDRQGGRFIASHIEIRDGGPVPDYVHFHAIAFQTIYCAKGWVRVVYEDQGEPFVLHAGDCALQPPRIRHRVLECSPGLEVVEVSAPAEHETFADHDLGLPTTTLRPERRFGGQRFVRHEASRAQWTARGTSGFEARDLGIADATDGLVAVSVVRATGAAQVTPNSHEDELQLRFVLAGSATLVCEGRGEARIVEGDAFCVPAGVPHALRDVSHDLELLEVVVPGEHHARG
jgi:quercetin dioxygenase-like cupin family protein